MKKERTQEQIEARRAKSKERREARKEAIPVTDANRATLEAGFKALMAQFEAGTLSIKAAGQLWSQPKTTNLSKAELEAKVAKEKARLARLEALLRG